MEKLHEIETKKNSEILWENEFGKLDQLPWITAKKIMNTKGVPNEYFRNIKRVFCNVIDNECYMTKQKFVNTFIKFDDKLNVNTKKIYCDSTFATYLRYASMPAFRHHGDENDPTILSNKKFMVRFANQTDLFFAFITLIKGTIYKIGISYMNNKYVIAKNYTCAKIDDVVDMSLRYILEEKFPNSGLRIEDFSPVKPIPFDDPEEKELIDFIRNNFGNIDYIPLIEEYGITSIIEAYEFINLFNNFLTRNSLENITKDFIKENATIEEKYLDTELFVSKKSINDRRIMGQPIIKAIKKSEPNHYVSFDNKKESNYISFND